MSATETQDPGRADGWSAWRAAQAGGEPVPRLRLLYHGDLARWGQVSDAVPAAGRWIVVGRNEPLFGDAALPIADPHVSREQLRLRWRPDLRCFEVEPGAAAKRAVAVVELDPSGPDMRPLTGTTLLAPGSVLAIGDRVLLGLDLGRPRAHDADRLGLVGESEPVWALRDEIRDVAQFARPVLVTGPTGAGKELVALALHRQSGRGGPFVPVNCAALPANLFESVLFGHRKGAFTGADADEKGVFRAADGGTVLLDEVGELPLAVQAKVLRVLQEGVVVPVGAHEGRRVDVRVVAATHRDLPALVQAGALREDLYHRVAAHVVTVPSLAERRFDVPQLFAHVLGRLRAQHPALDWLWAGGAAWRPAVPIGFVAELMRRPWTGNVRELENVAERTARLNLAPGAFRAPDPPVASEPPPPVAPVAPSAPDALVREACEALGLARKTVLKLLPADALVALGERAGDSEARRDGLRAGAGEALLRLLEARDFNQSVVAAELGTSRTTLIKLMDDLGLPRATDLGAEEIARARAEAGGDLDAAARLLRVSAVALRKRLTLLNLKSRG